MLIIITLLSSFLTSNINANPVPTFTFLPEPHIVSRLGDLSLATSCIPCQCPTNNSNDRGITNIVWSCLLTIFACTWTAIHPNIPAQEDGFWTVIGRKLQSMIFMLVAPEIVACWAIRQWLGARRIADQFKAYGWTRTHGFFIQMGGFMLYDGDQQLGILSVDKLQALVDSDAIEFPKISEKEIMDRSKGDYLAKAIIILQTSWFIVQCIARLARHLDLTEIELVAMAFPVLNWIMSFFWWNKPVDIQCSVPVFLKASHSSEKGLNEIVSGPIDSNPLLNNTSDTNGSTLRNATEHIRSSHSNEAQIFSLHSNPESSTSSLVPSASRSRCPSVRDDVHVHTSPIISNEAQEPALDETPQSSMTSSHPLANVCGVQVILAPTTSRRQSLRHNNDVHTVPQISNEAQDSEPNPEPSANSVPPENIRGVQATAPTLRPPNLRDDVDIHTTAAISTETRESLLDDNGKASIASSPPPADICGVQVILAPPTSRRQSLRHDVDVHTVLQISNEAQDSEPNPEPSANSVPEDIRGVQDITPTLHLPSLRDDVGIHTTAAISTEARDSLLDDNGKPSIARSPSPANIDGIQVTAPTIPRPSLRSLRDDNDIHIDTTPVIPPDQNFLPRDPSESGGLSRPIIQFSAESTYPELQNTWIWRTITFLRLTPFAAMAGVPMSGSASIPNHSKRVHTFYALSLGVPVEDSLEQESALSAYTGMIGVTFAAIHCIAWHFPFPTHLEQIIWRASALVPVVAPNLFVLLPMFGLVEYTQILHWFPLNVIRGAVMFSILVTLFFYFPARLYLLVEACISLRSLPPSALENVSWTSFIPHLA